MPDNRLGEVISVVSRRRRWTLEQKLLLVEAMSQPGVSVAAVSDRHWQLVAAESCRRIKEPR